jgi:hypothetical protein
MLSDNPDIKAVIDQVQIDPEAAMNPAPEVEPSGIAPVQEGRTKQYMWDLAEKMSLEQFLEYFPDDEEFWRGINDDPDTTDAEEVNEIKDPATQTEDPAGTKQPAYPEYQDDLAQVLKSAGVDDTVVAAPNYETGDETNECNDSPLKGQYGHPGKMKPVEKDTSFLDRLKQLSGMMRN